MERARKVIKVTRRGQTTIPVEFRRRHRIKEGSRLEVEDRGDSLLIRPVPSLEDLGGSLSKITTLERLLKVLEESREDEDGRKSWTRNSCSPTTEPRMRMLFPGLERSSPTSARNGGEFFLPSCLQRWRTPSVRRRAVLRR